MANLMPEKRTIFILPILVHFYAVADREGSDNAVISESIKPVALRPSVVEGN